METPKPFVAAREVKFSEFDDGNGFTVLLMKVSKVVVNARLHFGPSVKTSKKSQLVLAHN